MLIECLFLLGICVEAITGAIAAGRKRMDLFGVLIIANITALGGGTVRDLLLNHHPLTWIAHPYYLLFTSVSAIACMALIHRMLHLRRIFLYLDALGLAAFVVIGTKVALAQGFSSIIAIISGMITGICGGMLRDILCNDIPLVLRKELYAIIALLGSILYQLLMALHVEPSLILFITVLFVFSFRVIAIVFHIEMPKFDASRSIRKSREKK